MNEQALCAEVGTTRQSTEIDLVALRHWSEFLEDQEVVLNDAVRRGNGCPLTAQPSDVTFLQIDLRGDSESIDAAVYEFIKTKSWPKLSYARLRLLLLRTFMARRVMRKLLDEDVAASETASTMPKNLDRSADMIRWLLIDIWEQADAQSRRATITDFVRSFAGNKF